MGKPSMTKADSGILPTPSPRGRPRQFARDAALETAMEVFWQKGYMQTTLGDLCRAMGITAPSFYCAFSTKEAIFLETVAHYRDAYWNRALERFMAEEDLFTALANFFADAIKIYLRPSLPRGCFLDISTIGLSPREKRITETLASLDQKTRELFRKRLMLAIDAGQIPPGSDIPAIAGALVAFLKGIAAMARQDICQAELLQIAARGLLLLPQAGK